MAQTIGGGRSAAFAGLAENAMKDIELLTRIDREKRSNGFVFARAETIKRVLGSAINAIEANQNEVAGGRAFYHDPFDRIFKIRMKSRNLRNKFKFGIK